MNVSEICNICKKSSDQMLMLSCIHDPCLDCAAASFAEQVHYKNQNPHIYSCQICGEETALDSSTVEELNSLANAYIRMPTTIKTVQPAHHTRNKSNSNRQHQNYNASNIHQLGTQTHKKSLSKHQHKNTSPNKKVATLNQPMVYFCKEHSQEEISYYCFHCQENICPQCAIHGSHHDHNVRLIKKAIPEVKGEYLEIIQNIGISQTTMTKGKDLFLKEIKDINQRYGRDKMYMQRQFQNLKNCLIVKQKQMLKALERINRENIQILTGFLEEINTNYDEVAKVKKSIELILRKDEVLIFDEYRNIGQFELRVQEIKKNSEKIGGDITILDNQFIQKQMSRVSEHISMLREAVVKDAITMEGFYQKQSRVSNREPHPNIRESNVRQGSARNSSRLAESEVERRTKKYAVE